MQPNPTLINARRTSFVSASGVAGALLALGVAAIQWKLGSVPDGLVGVCCSVTCIITVLGWQLTNGHWLVSHLAVGMLATVFGAFSRLGLIGYVPWLGLVAVLAYQMVGLKAGSRWGIAILLMLGVAWWTLADPASGTHLSPGSPTVRLLRVASLVPALGILGYFFEHQRRRDVHAIELAMAAQSRLLASVSHEMRTPLNGIIGTTQALRLGPLPPSIAEGLSTIQYSGETLLSLINDLLDVARAEAGTTEHARHAFDVRRMVELTTSLHQPRAAANGSPITVQLPAAAVGVVGDSVRMQQVVGNLVANAIRHGGGAPITVTLRADRTAGHVKVSVSVADQGPGIDATAQRRLFQPFSQLDPKTAAGGSGLGLFISRTIARDLGGDLTLVSEAGRGATFTLSLILPEATLAAASEATPPPIVPLQGRVLVVDDNPINLRVARGLLTKLGLSVETADCGEAALEVAGRQSRPDLVLMDLQMPGLDGFETTRRLRSAGFSAPIVALTASAQPETEKECLRSGMNGCLVKPMRLEQLQPMLHRLLAA